MAGDGEDRRFGFGPEVKRRIMLGTYALSSGYYDAYYIKAQQVRTLIRREFDQVFSQVDALVTPPSPVVAFPLGEKPPTRCRCTWSMFTPCRLTSPGCPAYRSLAVFPRACQWGCS